MSKEKYKDFFIDLIKMENKIMNLSVNEFFNNKNDIDTYMNQLFSNMIN